MSWTKAFEFVVGAEGGYVNDPHDPGGETKYGISKRSYPDVDIANLTEADARNIYWRDYWKPMHCDLFSYPKALCLFDCAVNQGKRNAAKFAQRAVCVTDDGIIGPRTISAITATRDDLFVREFLREREEHYHKLKTFDRYGKGWLARLEHVRNEVGYA